MIKPLLRDAALLADVELARRIPGLHLWWLGQSGFLVQWESRHFLFDPYLSDSLTRKYSSTDKPHVRMTELVVDPVKLGFVDAVTSSHNHTDHLDAETLLPIFEQRPRLPFIIPAANVEFACQRLKSVPQNFVGMNEGETREVAGFKVHAVAAAHEKLDRDTEGRIVYLGYVVEFGPYRIYHSGDTVLYPGMEEALKAFNVDIAILPINGADPARKVSGNLNGEEAARLAKAIGAKVVIPCHYEMFEFNTASPGLFETTAKALGQPYRTMRAGERFTYRGRSES